MTILDEIFAHKRREVEHQKQICPLDEVRAAAESVPAPLDFAAALRAAANKPALIAEVKFASPSKGVLVAHPDPLCLAQIYRENGATALSVLTDERYFHGCLDYLSAIAGRWPDLPLLRKDFICDPYQVYEARLAGADALLLIVAGLERKALWELHDLTVRLGLTPLVEVHSKVEVETALACGATLIGINNRDMRDFSVSLETTFRLCRLIPAGVTVVAESGIHSPEDVRRLGEAGVDAILVGEALVTAADIAARVRSLAGPMLASNSRQG
jgi:indole-3-glycerol phosphate synthase